MSRTIAMRFKLSGTNYDFYDDEVNELEITHSLQRIIYKNISGKWGIYRLGTDDSEYKIFDVEFINKYGPTATWDKIYNLWYADALSGQPQMIEFYYKYAIDSTANCQVKMIRQMFSYDYFSGHRVANNLIPISFIEVKPEGVGMIQNPMLTVTSAGV